MDIFKDFSDFDQIIRESKEENMLAVFRAKYKKKRVVVKFFLEISKDSLGDKCRSDAEDFDKYLFETAMYETISEYNFVHFVKFLGHGVIPTHGKEGKPFKRSFEKHFKVLRDMMKGCICKRIHYIVTERRPGSTGLKKVFPKLTPEERKSVLFQIINNLRRMDKLGWRHNDLHLNNILIDTYYPDEIEEAKVGKVKFEIPLKGKDILFFDWDLAAMRDRENEYLDDAGLCKNYGVCNSDSDKFDLFTVMIMLLNRKDTIDEDTFDFALRVVGPIEVNKKGYYTPVAYNVKFDGRICKIDGSKCQPLGRGEPLYMMTPKQALLDPYFNSLRV
jgi:serine/threonine protein kinase